MSLVFDSARNVCTLHRGIAFSGGAERETWEWNGNDWVLVYVHPKDPPSGIKHGMAYDSLRRVVVLFGGDDGEFLLNETWEWNGVDWNRRTGLIPRPIEREDPGMAFDSRRGVTVMFGGFDAQHMGLNDTWEFDGQRWELRDVQPRPLGGAARGMAFDGNRGVTVLKNGPTWEWDGDQWLQVAPAGPPQFYSPMIYDDYRQICVLLDTSEAGRIWEWDGREWRVFDPAGVVPRRRQFQAVAYDSHRQRIVMFGGDAGTGILEDTWEFGLYPDCDTTTTGAGTLDIFDFLCFGNKFDQADSYACNCDTSTGNNICDIFDFLCFQNLFAQCGP